MQMIRSLRQNTSTTHRIRSSSTEYTQYGTVVHKIFISWHPQRDSLGMKVGMILTQTLRVSLRMLLMQGFVNCSTVAQCSEVKLWNSVISSSEVVESAASPYCCDDM